MKYCTCGATWCEARHMCPRVAMRDIPGHVVIEREEGWQGDWGVANVQSVWNRGPVLMPNWMDVSSR